MTAASFLPPPFANGGYGERGGLVRDADDQGATIGLGIIYAIQDSDALGQRGKVVVVDGRWHPIHLAPVFLKRPTIFRFLASTLIIGLPAGGSTGAV